MDEIRTLAGSLRLQASASNSESASAKEGNQEYSTGYFQTYYQVLDSIADFISVDAVSERSNTSAPATMITKVISERSESDTTTFVSLSASRVLDVPNIDLLLDSEDSELQLRGMIKGADQGTLQAISDRIRARNIPDEWDNFLELISDNNEPLQGDDIVAFLSDAFAGAKSSERAVLAATLGKIGSHSAVSFLRSVRMREGNRFVLSVINAYLDQIAAR
jgi:hypothetical protein